MTSQRWIRVIGGAVVLLWARSAYLHKLMTDCLQGHSWGVDEDRPMFLMTVDSGLMTVSPTPITYRITKRVDQCAIVVQQSPTKLYAFRLPDVSIGTHKADFPAYVRAMNKGRSDDHPGLYIDMGCQCHYPWWLFHH